MAEATTDNVRKVQGLEAEWKDFEREVIPPNAGVVQRHDMRVSFYAGAGLVLRLCKAIADPSVSEAQSVAAIDAWMKEYEKVRQEIIAAGADEPEVEDVEPKAQN